MEQGTCQGDPPPVDPGRNKYDKLDAGMVVATAELLSSRVSERFPGSGLAAVCRGLLAMTEGARDGCDLIVRPHLPLRIALGVVIAGIVGVVVFIGLSVEFTDGVFSASQFVPLLEAGMNAAVLIGAGILFLVTVERRLNRARALKALHGLRSMAHVIDMHQLTKDPERLLGRGADTEHSPRRTMDRFLLARYLNYCTEMLSLVGKVAALYAERLDDAVVLGAVNDMESLTTDLSHKIWQKITTLSLYAERASDEPAPDGAGAGPGA